MIGGITTYLIIYIQFYALYGKEGETLDTPPRNQQETPPQQDTASRTETVSKGRDLDPLSTRAVRT